MSNCANLRTYEPEIKRGIFVFCSVWKLKFYSWVDSNTGTCVSQSGTLSTTYTKFPQEIFWKSFAAICYTKTLWAFQHLKSIFTDRVNAMNLKFFTTQFNGLMFRENQLFWWQILKEWRSLVHNAPFANFGTKIDGFFMLSLALKVSLIKKPFSHINCAAPSGEKCRKFQNVVEIANKAVILILLSL